MFVPSLSWQKNYIQNKTAQKDPCSYLISAPTVEGSVPSVACPALLLLPSVP